MIVPDWRSGRRKSLKKVFAPCYNVKTMNVEQLKKLQERIDAAFTGEEIQTLCHRLDLDYFKFPHLMKRENIAVLVAEMNRQNRLEELIKECEKLKPNHPWFIWRTAGNLSGSARQWVQQHSGSYRGDRHYSNPPAQATANSLVGRSRIEQLRFDAAVPSAVEVGRSFILALSVRQLHSPVLVEQELDQVESSIFAVNWPIWRSKIELRLEISAPECVVRAINPKIVIKRGQDSRIYRYHLIPQKAGAISILVILYAHGVMQGNTPVKTTAVLQPVVQTQMTIQSEQLMPKFRENLYQQIEATFNVNELKTLAYRLNLDYEDIFEDTKSGSIREFVLYCERHQIIGRLIDACKRLRPHKNWSFAS